MPINTVLPSKDSAIYKAAELINKAGPHQLVELFAAVDFGPPKQRQEKLDRAFFLDWLRYTPSNLLDITEKARRHFAAQEPKVEYVGQITPARYRGDWRVSTLNKKNIPSRHGLRPASDSAPTWSLRESLSIKTVSGGDL